MEPTDLIAPGASAGAVAIVFMFKMYLDKRKNDPGISEIRKLRNDIHDKERREEMKPLAEAITQLTLAVKEMHASHQIQVRILESIGNKIQGGFQWKEQRR